MTSKYNASPLTLAAHAAGLTLADVGRAGGLSRASVAHVACGLQAPSAAMLRCISAALAITEDEAQALCPRKRGQDRLEHAPAKYYMTLRGVQVKHVAELLPGKSRAGVNLQLKQSVRPHDDLVAVVEKLTATPRELLFPKYFGGAA